MHIQWDENRCTHSGLCTALAPDVLHMNDAAELEISNGNVDAHQAALEDAANSCPTQAITLVD